MRADLIYGPCPGFGFRTCLHCKKSWLTTAPDACVVTARYCPTCIPLITETLKDWQLNPRYGPLPERRPAEQRIRAAMEKHRRRRELSVAHQREEIGKQRRTA